MSAFLVRAFGLRVSACVLMLVAVGVLSAAAQPRRGGIVLGATFAYSSEVNSSQFSATQTFESFRTSRLELLGEAG